eukprot:gene53838-25510_t
MLIGTDATIKGGVSFPIQYKKWLRAQEVAQHNELPCIYLIDGGGAKLDAQSGKGPGRKGGKPTRDTSYEGGLPAEFTWGGRQFYNQARMSALRIPQIAVICGMCTAGGAYTPAMCDETIIVKDNGAMMHTTKSGTCDHYAPDEDTALAMCREVVENLGRRRPRASGQGGS